MTSNEDTHTVPQSLEYSSYSRRCSTINDTDKMFMEENSSSRSYSPASSSEGELCIDETMSSVAETDDQETPKHHHRSKVMSISPTTLHLNMLDRYKIPSQIPVIYHKNMARQFPEAHGKTEQQKLQRKKNTEAARQSRAKAKILENIVESECRQAAMENVNAKRMIATQRAYANTLLNLLGTEEVNWEAKWKEQEASRCEL